MAAPDYNWMLQQIADNIGKLSQQMFQLTEATERMATAMEKFTEAAKDTDSE